MTHPSSSRTQRFGDRPPCGEARGYGRQQCADNDGREDSPNDLPCRKLNARVVAQSVEEKHTARNPEQGAYQCWKRMRRGYPGSDLAAGGAQRLSEGGRATRVEHRCPGCEDGVDGCFCDKHRDDEREQMTQPCDTWVGNASP